VTGPEHYLAAEQAISASTWQYQQWGEQAGDTEQDKAAQFAILWELRRAQVHATLALAAAVGTGMAKGEPSVRDEHAWMAAAGTHKPAESSDDQ
jgi:hypothetical protein